MIVVNDPGTRSAVYPQLEHAEWHGWTFADTIFPSFLFVAGVSLVLSLTRRRAGGATRSRLLGHLAARAAALIAIGLMIQTVRFLAFHEDHLRYPGILQRIALCVLAAGAVYLAGGARAAVAVAAALLVGYWALLAAGPLEPGTNLAARVDRVVFGAHTLQPGWDPEGLLATLPAIATTLLGVLAGHRLRDGLTSRVIGELAGAGAAAAAAGALWGCTFSINKNLWTSSFALGTAGLACLGLAACAWLVDVHGCKRAAAPWTWLGRNAIAAFTLSSLGAIALAAVRVSGPDGSRALWTAVYQTVFNQFADPRLGSLLFALAYLAVWMLVFGALHRRGVFFRI